jgi:hypothetical protein
MAKAFQDMLERFGIAEKILAFNADNATSNDTQTEKLDAMDNSFEKTNRARCFNHTLQLSAKTLLAPFNTAISSKAVQDDELLEGDSDGLMVEDKEDDELAGEDGIEGDVEGDIEEKDDADDGINELEELSEDEQGQVLESTAVVREMVTKVRTYQYCSPIFF